MPSPAKIKIILLAFKKHIPSTAQCNLELYTLFLLSEPVAQSMINNYLQVGAFRDSAKVLSKSSWAECMKKWLPGNICNEKEAFVCSSHAKRFHD
ncbi:hypothetical protein NIES4071_33220 [Calothrix sp. NIES-4071]|nr:hypothetical protein NIES4071_33220 [Calothrix sp. NIES-4071]BAZ57641.1 hypothetical protein NIES4105_33150 [Calothrix sp. NIES-4105]